MDTGHRLTGGEFTEFQRRAERHLAFSLTRACPLRCAHCIVATVAPSARAGVTLPLDQARRMASGFPALADAGVTRVSFTGGEPLLAPLQLDVLSEAAYRSGIGCTVVTACHWAATEQTTARILDRFQHIDTWHLSTDVFHERFIPAEFVLRAAAAAGARGRVVVVRMAIESPPSDEDLELVTRIKAGVPTGVKVAVATVVKAGRAEDLDVEVPAWRGRSVPCISTGPTIRDDGTVSPCCGSLSDQRGGHPFVYPNAFSAGLDEVHVAWAADPLLTLVRTVGFAPVLDWVRRTNPDHPVLAEPPDHPCDICVALWREPGTAEAIGSKARQPATAGQIRALHDEVFLAPTATNPHSDREAGS